MPGIRLLFLLVFLGCAGLLAFGYYLQYVEFIEPCPLCIIQRVCFFLGGVTALVAALHNPGALGRRIYAVVMALSGIAGAAVASRQVWLQHLPKEQVPECGPGLSYMLEMYPLGETLAKVFKGSGECAEAGWTFLGFSIAEWALVAFIALIAVSVFQMFRKAIGD